MAKRMAFGNENAFYTELSRKCFPRISISVLRRLWLSEIRPSGIHLTVIHQSNRQSARTKSRRTKKFSLKIITCSSIQNLRCVVRRICMYRYTYTKQRKDKNSIHTGKPNASRSGGRTKKKQSKEQRIAWERQIPAMLPPTRDY